jgi:membrane associated rhomboid family serine protease
MAISRYFRLWFGEGITGVILFTTVVVFFGQVIEKQFAGTSHLEELLALSNTTLENGTYWQFLTFGWLHSTSIIIHIFFNLLMLRFLGPLLEQDLGKTFFTFLYLGGLASSGFLCLILNINDEVKLVGASGAVFALLLAAGTLYRDEPVKALLLLVIPIKTRLGRLAWTMFFIEFIFLFVSVLIPFSEARRILPDNIWGQIIEVLFWGVSHAAHIGGALFGWLAVISIASKRNSFFDPSLPPP